MYFKRMFPFAVFFYRIRRLFRNSKRIYGNLVSLPEDNNGRSSRSFRMSIGVPGGLFPGFCRADTLVVYNRNSIGTRYRLFLRPRDQRLQIAHL